MLDNASPRNPRLFTLCKSSALVILLVAWRRNAWRTCDASIPLPLSVIRIKEIPPSLISTVIAKAPASMAFSTSSFTTLEGRSTTSPAAILSIVPASNTCIFAMLFLLSRNPLLPLLFKLTIGCSAYFAACKAYSAHQAASYC